MSSLPKAVSLFLLRKKLKNKIMAFFGNLIKGVVNVAVSPIVLVTDVVKGDFENSSRIIENVVDSVGEGTEDLLNGDL